MDDLKFHIEIYKVRLFFWNCKFTSITSNGTYYTVVKRGLHTKRGAIWWARDERWRRWKEFYRTDSERYTDTTWLFRTKKEKSSQ